MTTPHLHTDFIMSLKHFAKATELFEKLVEGDLILGNNNHIGDTGEYWVRRYYERLGKFKRYQAYPPFRWWPWLDDYLVRFEIKNGDMELLP